MYILLFILLALYALIENKLDTRSKGWAFVFLALFLTLFAGLRGNEVDRDYLMTYDYDIHNLPSIKLLFTDFQGFYKRLPQPEFSFCVLSSFIKEIFPKDPTRIVILIYAALAVPLKLYAIKKIATKETFGFVVLVYFANLFLLQEMTQIRAGLATAFFLLSLPHIYNRNLGSFLGTILIGILIHKSMIAALPLYFFNPKEINFKLWMSTLLFFLVLCLASYSLLNIIESINLPIFSQKIQTYIKMQQWHQIKMNPLNTFLLLQIAVSYIVYKYRGLVEPHFKYLYLFIKLNLASVIIFYIFISVPGFAFRLSDYYGVAQIFLIPLLIHVFKPRYLAQTLVISIAFCILLFNIYHNELLKPYYLCFFD